MRIVIIGGGIMGCSTALALGQRGGEVRLLERSVPGAEASTAAAGILGAQIEGHEPGATFDRCLRARTGYAPWAAELREATGIDVGYRKCGVLKVGMSEAELVALREMVSWQAKAGLRAELLDGAGVRAVEAPLTDGICGGAYFPDDAQIDPPTLLRALVAALARMPNVHVESGQTVRGLRVEGERCVGVDLGGETVSADATVLAAGSWSSLVPGLPKDLPEVKPVRGQMVLLEERPPSVRTVVFGAGGYIVPRDDGRVICGSTMENVGYRREVTAEGLLGLLRTATTLVPRLGAAQVGPAWSNFRPFASSPMIGASIMPGLFLATGHHRNGILLAHDTGEEVARAILG